MVLEGFLSVSLLGNAGKDYLIALGIFIGLFIVFRLFDSYFVYFLKKNSRKTKNKWDDLVIDFIDGIAWPFYAYLALFIAIHSLILPEIVSNISRYLLVLFIAFYAGKGFVKIINHITEKEINKRKEKGNGENTSMINVLGFVAKGIVWVAVLLMVLANFGIEITPLIAGLGIGGIAIALAVQAILGDLFSAFVIYFDKPFKEGDFIIVGNDMGVVKYIGIKSTRIETLQGQELIISNSELTNTRINNYKRMNKRRIVFTFGVEYDTSVKKLEKIKRIVEKIVKDVKLADLDRVHFKSFGDFSLIYEVVYYVNSPDYTEYMNVQEEINLALKKAFEKEKIVFAFPTQTIHLEK